MARGSGFFQEEGQKMREGLSGECLGLSLQFCYHGTGVYHEPGAQMGSTFSSSRFSLFCMVHWRGLFFSLLILLPSLLP